MDNRELEDDRDYDEEDPSVATLIVRGILVILFAFVAAIQILIVHVPSGH